MPVLAGLLLAAFAGSASADVLYASPAGVGSVPCAQAAPCSLANAVDAASSAGGDVQLLGGEYGSAQSPITTRIASSWLRKIGPAPGVTRPLIYFGGAGGLDIYDNASLSDVTIEGIATSSSYGPLFINGGTAARVFVRTSSGVACTVYGNSALRNSVCMSTDNLGGVGVSQTGASGQTFTSTIRNVTGWTTGVGGHGLSSNVSGSNSAGHAVVTNSIFHGGVADISVSGGLGSGTSAVSVDSSNFAKSVATAGGTITSVVPGSNQTAPPVLGNPAGGDFTELIASPTIDGGSPAGLGDDADLVGAPRNQGGSVDIGAYEFTPQSTAITAFAITPSKFRAASAGHELVSAKAKAPVGAKVTVGVNGRSQVKFTADRAGKGRKVGKLCKRESHANRSKKPCTRYAALSGFSWVTLSAGSLQLGLSARLKGKKLEPGKYRLRAVPVAAGAPAGAPAFAKFTVSP
jgi:hypothetical protein